MLALSLLASLGASSAPDPLAPKVTLVCAVAPDILGVKIQCAEVVWGRQHPYEPQPGDRIDDPDHQRWVIRDGKCIGALAGAQGTIIRDMDRVVGQRLDPTVLSDTTTYRLSAHGDPAYAQPTGPTALHRKSKPTALARTGPWAFESPVEHTVYLHLPAPLKRGAQYTLTFAGSLLPERTFTFLPDGMRSEAVHVTHLGFRPDDPAKVGFLSCWLGDGGGLTYPAGLTFHVLDASGAAVFTGTLRLSKAADAADEDVYKTNHNGTDVWEADFTPFARAGNYRLCVDGIGCSYPFVIADDVWQKAFIVSARGFLHQRSGVALGPPYTDYRRPRCFHPDDGVKVYASSAGLMDTGNGLNSRDSNFGNLVKGKTDQIVPNAWGGYMDAGDWDRRVQHLCVSRLLLELTEMFPERFAHLSLNLPESGNGLPDIDNEALFDVDLCRRMQTPEGGIRGGIESSEHPRQGEASWQESQTVMAYAPDPWSSYEYAGVAARAARVLRPTRPALADGYLASALRAMEWAEQELRARSSAEPPRPLPDPHAVNDSRNLAAAELFRTTGDGRWNRLFLETTAFTDPRAEIFVYQDHEQRDAPWVYVQTEQPGADAPVKENCRRAILREADARAASTDRTGFRWAKYEWRPTGTGSLTSPDGVSLVRAHRLTRDPKYLRALVLACQAGAGANPVNLCYTTGLGHASPLHPLHIDSQATGQAPPPGLTVFGPCNPAQMKQEWALDFIDKTCYPPSRQWPIIEAYFDVFWYPLVCEFTVQAPMAGNAYVWGYLMARS
jgi:endoglucanase